MPVILDGAQGSGAVPVDVQALGCVAYAAAGQKWLCGADGTGMLYLDPEFGERVRTIAPTYGSFEDASRGLESTLRAGGRALRRARSRARRSRSRSPRWRCSSRPTSTRSMERAADLADTFADRARGRRPHGRAARAQHAGRVRVPRARRGARERLAEAGHRRARPARPSRTCAPRSAPGTTSPTSSACSPRCEVRLRLLRVELRRGPGLRRGGDRSSRGRSRRAACGSSTAARTSA